MTWPPACAGSSPQPGSRLRSPSYPANPVLPPRLPLCRARIRQSAGLLAQLAGHLAAPGPVPARGVAMASQLLADGTGPLYRQACGEDLGHILHAATQALTL